MKKFTPALPYTTAAELLIPSYSTSKGVTVKTYPAEGVAFSCSFKTYGGTETVENDVFSVIDTAQVETWYRPEIKADCRIRLLLSGDVYEIIGRPEDIEQRHQFCRFKVRAVEGGA